MPSGTDSSVLWNNICRLMGYEAGGTGPSIDKVRARVGVGRGTVQRIKENSAATRLDSLEAIAKKLGVPAWLLLQPPEDALLLSPRSTYIGRELDAIADPKARDRAMILCESFAALAKAGQMDAAISALQAMSTVAPAVAPTAEPHPPRRQQTSGAPRGPT